MTYTLKDYSDSLDPSKDFIKKGVIETFRRASPIMNELTFETTGTLKVDYIRTKSLPTVTWRKVGANFTESKALTEPLQEKIHFCGGYIDVPKEYVKATDQLYNVRAYQSEMFVKSMAYSWNDVFINGSPEVNEDQMIGLTYRINKDLAAAQKIIATATTGLDVSPDATSLSTNQATLINQIHRLIHACDDHTCNMLLMNDSMYLALMDAIRHSGLLNTTKDNYGDVWPTFGAGGPKIIDLGYKADQTTKIITDTETVAGVLTGGAMTSIYAVKTGEPGYVKGWQFAPIDAMDMGLLESGVAYRTIVDWGVGLIFANPRSIARLYAITAA